VSRWLTQTAWNLWKDILLTFGGLTLIMVEVFAVPEPSTDVIVTGLALTGIGASFHLGAIAGGFIGKSSSSPPTPPGGLPHSPSSQEPSGNGR
jgi:hypothetical protein